MNHNSIVRDRVWTQYEHRIQDVKAAIRADFLELAQFYLEQANTLYAEFKKHKGRKAPLLTEEDLKPNE